MEISTKVPFYTRVTSILLGAIAFVFIMEAGSEIIIPLVYATIIAILLNPFVNFLMRKRINKIVAISIAVLLTIILVLTLLFVLSTRIDMFTESYPQLKEKFNIASNEFNLWASRNFNVRQWQIKAWITDSRAQS